MRRPTDSPYPHHRAARWRHDGDEDAPQADPADLGTAFGLELSLAAVARAQPLARGADEPQPTP